MSAMGSMGMRYHARVRRFSLREFFAPWPLVAVALMVVNDRWLKGMFHNGVTGKLSDVAICFFLPLFSSALLSLVWQRHPRARIFVGAVVASAVFVGQESWPAFQAGLLAMLDVVGRPLGIARFQLTADPTDLLALLMVPVAVWYGLRRVRGNHSPT
jgi:hypothetical protein